jgi:hypothetical protein
MGEAVAVIVGLAIGLLALLGLIALVERWFD